MLKDISYTLMAGVILALVVWMINEKNLAERGIDTPDHELSVLANTWDETSFDAQTEAIIAWVDEYNLQDPTYTGDWLDLKFSSDLVQRNQPSSAEMLEPGMPRHEVRRLLGDPSITQPDEQRWVYDDVTVVFDEQETVQGWLVMAEKDTIHQTMRNVMMPFTTPAEKETEPVAPRKWAVGAPYISGGGSGSSSGRSGGGYQGGNLRRSMQRSYQRTNAFSRRQASTFRRPAFLNNMFGSRSSRTRRGSLRNRTHRSYNPY